MSETDSPSPQPPPKRNVPEYLLSDPLQARLIRRWAIGAIVTVVALWLLFGYWHKHANAYDVLHRMYALCYAAGLLLLAVAFHAIRYARRIFAASQYPPPGGWVFGKTLVLRDGAARNRGVQVVVCGIALALLGLYSLYLPHSISTMLLPGTVPIQVDPSPASDTASGKKHG